jgi:hypothetical protein
VVLVVWGVWYGVVGARKAAAERSAEDLDKAGKEPPISVSARDAAA